MPKSLKLLSQEQTDVQLTLTDGALMQESLLPLLICKNPLKHKGITQSPYVVSD